MSSEPNAVPIQNDLGDLESILISEEQIAAKVAELGARLSHDYQGKPLVLVGVLKGCIVFLADLSRRLTIPHEIDLVGAQSYKSGSLPAGKVTITKDIDLDLKDHDVLLVEDIYDTGSTLHVIHGMLKMYQPRSLEICAFLYKKKERENGLPIKYYGFEIEDVFVVGYGLDYREKYRYLRSVGILNPDISGS